MDSKEINNMISVVYKNAINMYYWWENLK